MKIHDLETPAVTIDLDRMEANIARAQKLCDDAGIALRPHIKTHKIPEIARLQLEAGAKGLTCQKLTEAEVFIDSGVTDDILISYNIIGRKKTDRLMALSERIRRLAVVADNETVLRGLSDAGREAGREVPVLIEIDAGIGRNGAQTPEDAVALARLANALAGVTFDGLMTYPNTEVAAAFITKTLALLDADGIAVNNVSGGGTAALLTLADYPMMTEHRAGTYVFNDRMTMRSGWSAMESSAMLVRATVVSVPNDDRCVIDAGSKTLTGDQYGLEGHGLVVGYPDALVKNLSEEHGVIDLTKSAKKPKVGEMVAIIPNHTCVVTNMVDELHGFRGDEVEVTWPVAARGKIL